MSKLDGITPRECFLMAHSVYAAWAVAYRRYSQDYTDEEHEARTARAGVWASAFIRPWIWRRGERL